MKKCLILILAALLALSAAAFAGEAEEKEAELYDLWDYGGESMTWIATGVPVSPGVLMVSAAVLPEDQSQLAVSDGKSMWEAKAVLEDDGGLTALVLFDTEEKEPGYGFWMLLPYGESVPASSCIVRSGDELGSRINHRVLAAATVYRKGIRCLLLTLEEAVPPGSPVLTQDGKLAGIVIADYAEGEHRVLALPAEELAFILAQAQNRMTRLPGWGDPPEGFRISADKNLVTFDWKEMTLPDKKDGEEIYLVVLDAGNDYLSFFPAETEERSRTMLLAPGRIYIAGIMVSEKTPDRVPERFDTIALPAARKLTAHHFRSLVCSVAEMPENAGENDKPVPVTEVTEDLLRSGRAFFYSTSCYEVTEELSNLSLLVTLTDPEGRNYLYESSWIYGPEYMNEDTWYIPLTQSGLVSGLDRNGYPRGVYRMAFFVDGELADSFSFELK